MHIISMTVAVTILLVIREFTVIPMSAVNGVAEEKGSVPFNTFVLRITTLGHEIIIVKNLFEKEVNELTTDFLGKGH